MWIEAERDCVHEAFRKLKVEDLGCINFSLPPPYTLFDPDFQWPSGALLGAHVLQDPLNMWAQVSCAWAQRHCDELRKTRVCTVVESCTGCLETRVEASARFAEQEEFQSKVP